MNKKIFLTFQNGQDSITIAAELYNDKYPITTSNFFNNCTSSKQNYKYSNITRVVSPEFIIQGGNIRNSQQLLANKEYFTNLNDFKTLGKLVIVSNPSSDEELLSHEFFITLSDLSHYAELQNYMVIGEVLSSLTELINWGNEISVDEDGIPRDIIITRCGELVKKRHHSSSRNSRNT